MVLLKLALELLVETDARRPRPLGRLGLALACRLNPKKRSRRRASAGDLIAVSEGEHAAAEYLAEAADAIPKAGSLRAGAALASQATADTGRVTAETSDFGHADQHRP